MIYYSEDFNKKYETVISDIKYHYENSFPLVCRRFHRYKDIIQKWMTRGILVSIENRDNLHMDCLKTLENHPSKKAKS